MASHTYDAIVVGSGITGGWAAKEQTEKGLETLVLEAGRPIDPTDYVEHVPMSEARFRGMGDRRRDDENQPIQQNCSALDELNSKFFVNDRENPYVTDQDKPFLWIRGRQVGGLTPRLGSCELRHRNRAEHSGVVTQLRSDEIAVDVIEQQRRLEIAAD